MAEMKQKPKNSLAFTLVELLVVIGIIGVLLGILIPVVGKARATSMRTTCAAQLRDIGAVFNMYLNENKLRVPRVNPLPSQKPAIVDAPSIYETLDRYTKDVRAGWKCPADAIRNPPDPKFETYFDREGGSYEYNSFFNAFAYDEKTGINKVWRDALKDAEHGRLKPDRLRIFSDFEPFHGKAGTRGAMNYLFADFHVGDILDK